MPKIIRFYETGGADVLKVEQLPLTEPTEGEVRLKVEAFSLNRGEVIRAQEIKTRDELVTGYNEFLANLVVAMGRAFSPNPNNPPFYADLPYTYNGDNLLVNYEVLGLME